ncbi:thioredoxin domain-containing protein [Pseudofrancisella aestuarii]|uniref:Thioredoxin domain-containing protein n=1 Tax=Pseudofrancisella aestuarii TaxID=2670347 RepID=A0ABV9TD43_9GAMM|nr:thioredoxin domain-containing protein [Pseudofrancisella aestuarii]
MKKLTIALLGTSLILMSGCSEQNTKNKTEVAISKDTINYSANVANPKIINQLLNDNKTPYLGNKNAEKAVVVFFDYSCSKCAEISKEVSSILKNNPNVKIIFKPYPSSNRDMTVANYASLIAYEAYIQGGPALFDEYNKSIFQTRISKGKITFDEINSIADKLNIKIDKAQLNEAAKEELESRQLGKEIGFDGPHAFIILPTNLANMDKNELNKHLNEIHVIADKQTNEAASTPEDAAKWVSNQIQNALTNS